MAYQITFDDYLVLDDKVVGSVRGLSRGDEHSRTSCRDDKTAFYDKNYNRHVITAPAWINERHDLCVNNPDFERKVRAILTIYG
ncbi:MAG: hypothetical protein ACFB2Z_09330 [Maricaulaceae bacterium]